MEHPPYSPWDFANDMLWMALFVTSAVFSVRSNLRWKPVLPFLLIFLGVDRLVLESPGRFLVYEFAAMVVVAVIAVAGLLQGRRSSKPKHDELPTWR